MLAYAGLFSGKHSFKTGMRSAKLTRLCNTISYFEVLKNYDYNLYGYLPNFAEPFEIIPEFENNDESFLGQIYFEPFKKAWLYLLSRR